MQQSSILRLESSPCFGTILTLPRCLERSRKENKKSPQNPTRLDDWFFDWLRYCRLLWVCKVHYGSLTYIKYRLLYQYIVIHINQQAMIEPLWNSSFRPFAGYRFSWGGMIFNCHHPFSSNRRSMVIVIYSYYPSCRPGWGGRWCASRASLLSLLC